MAIEILAIMLKKSQIKPYMTMMGTSHLLDIYADDLTIYLRKESNNKAMDCRNVQEEMRVAEVFC